MKSSPRGAARVRLVAVHTTEGVMKVSDLRAFFDRANAAGSSHAGVDRTGKIAGPEGGFVPYDRAAWTLRSGNPISDNVEYCGFARYTRQQWLTTEEAGLNALAVWVAGRCRARGIPAVKLSPADVRAGKSGIIGHHDWTVGMSDGSHWDPGPGFPWDVFIGKVRWLLNPTPIPTTPKETPDLDATERKMLTELHGKVVATPLPLTGRPGPGTDDMYGHVLNADAAAREATAIAKRTEEKVDKLVAAIARLVPPA